MCDEFKEVERLYYIKLAKYNDEDIDEALCDVLFEEAIREVMLSGYYNGGRKVRM